MNSLPSLRLIATLVLAAVGCTGCQSQQTYSSPEQAVSALAGAVSANDRGEIRRIFGPRVAELRSGSPDQDRVDLASFARAIEQSREIERRDESTAVLLVGEARWPFAVPLVSRDGGWQFDTAAGIEEIENRRIGRNELRTIAACRTIIDAQAEYRSVDRDGDGVLEFAQRLMSTPGTKDGLYWPAPGGVDPSPIGPVLAEAATRTDERGRRSPYNGYSYRALDRQGSDAPGGAASFIDAGGHVVGWALVAWPAEYDRTGVMTFITSHHGVVYEADLGPDTAQIVAQLRDFNPADPWRATEK